MCLLCGGSGVTAYSGLTDRFQGVPGRWDILHCWRCDLAWLTPRPIPEDLALCYPSPYYTHESPEPAGLGRNRLMRTLRSSILAAGHGYRNLASNSGLLFLGFCLNLAPPFRHRATNRADRFLPRGDWGSTVLDIGCGNGSFLAQLQVLGWTVAGVEPDPAAAHQARQSLNCKIWPGTLESVDFGGEQFDVVLSSHAIEHCPDPKNFVRCAARALKPGGKMLIRTPNYGALGRRMLGPDWYAMDTPRHLNLLTSRAVKQIFESLGGFESVQVSGIGVAVKTTVIRAEAVRRHGQFLSPVALSLPLRTRAAIMRCVEALPLPGQPLGEELLVIAAKQG